jgi:hypothetical protein
VSARLALLIRNDPHILDVEEREPDLLNIIPRIRLTG